jgi:hypothetical protein
MGQVNHMHCKPNVYLGHVNHMHFKPNVFLGCGDDRFRGKNMG